MQSLGFEAVPAGKTKYGIIKERLIHAYSASTKSKICSLLKEQMIGNHKPTQLLTLIKNEAQGECNDTMIRTIFLEHLPKYDRSILAVGDKTDLDTLALCADKILESQGLGVLSEVDSVNAVSETQAMKEMICSLASSMEKLASRLDGIQRSRGCSCNRSRTRSRHLSSSRERLCWYHGGFEKDSTKCTQSCSRKSAESSGSEN